MMSIIEYLRNFNKRGRESWNRDFLNFGMMENLHQEIKLDIISRLPVESVLNCRLLCKEWRDLIHLPYFAEMHLRNQLQRLDYQNHSQDAPPPVAAGDNVGFLILNTKKTSPIFYLEYDEDERSFKKVKTINHRRLKKLCYNDAMVGSCNGLVCFSIPCHYGIRDPVYICNPITNECINLPKFNILRDYKGVDINKDYNDDRMVSGFGYNPSTNEYKVVRIIYYNTINDPVIGRVQVYTLGDGNGWRKKGEITYQLIPRYSYAKVSRSILANGALHWLEYKDWDIVVFDMETEEFSLLPSPPCCYLEHKYVQLQVFGGCLCVIEQDRHRHCLNIWSFKKRSCEWESMFCISYDTVMTGELHYHIPRNISRSIALTLGGEVLLLLPHDKRAFRYDPKTATLEKFVQGVEGLGKDLNEAIPYMSSFVSLRALGENTKRIR